MPIKILDFFADSSPSGTPEKKQKVAAYKVGAEQKKRITQDSVNKKLWDEALEHTSEGGQVGDCCVISSCCVINSCCVITSCQVTSLTRNIITLQRWCFLSCGTFH